MATHSAINTLIELATKDSDEAAKRLGMAIRACEEAEQKLALLLQYRDDYAARCQSDLSAGLTAAGYHNFRVFLEKLDSAIAGQREVIREAQKLADKARSVWQECERKRMSFGALDNRAKKQAQQYETRRDQKLTDEHATRKTLYKR
ncbi:flagellar export protein FliJ [Sulfuriferula sp. GW1]|uniref:flagellar export protein FliJ n=1 Tax=Sulfuriferula sp. GW1 TaxID=3345111 RepID=UPI0039B07117